MNKIGVRMSLIKTESEILGEKVVLSDAIMEHQTKKKTGKDNQWKCHDRKCDQNLLDAALHPPPSSIVSRYYGRLDPLVAYIHHLERRNGLVRGKEEAQTAIIGRVSRLLMLDG